VFGTGNPKARIASIGEAPGPEEDKRGEPFVGRAGQLHDEFWKSVEITRADLWLTNTVKCFPGRNEKGGIAKPSENAIETCTEKWLHEELRVLKPRVIIAWGLTAAHAFGVPRKLTMAEAVGREFETEYGIVVPLYHPSYFLRNPADFMNRQKVIDALGRAVVLAGIRTQTMSGADQAKTERHQEDKKVIAALESKSNVFERHPWNDDRAYSIAWTDATDVVLIYKDAKNRKRHEVIQNFEWYFYLRTSDLIEKIPASFVSKWMREGLLHRLVADDVNPEWTQVYARRHVVRTWALREHVLESDLSLWDDRVLDKYKEDKRLRVMLDEIESYGVEHFEADLTPMRRFMTDYDIKILDVYDEMFVDIETDDTIPLTDWKDLANRRILSIAWEIIWADRTRKPEKGFLLLKKETDRAEREMLEEFIRVIEGIDVMYAWNGNNFDFPILRQRMRKFRMAAMCWETIHIIDLLGVWRRYFQRGASVNTSYALQSIARHILKKEKLDWRTMAKERGLNITSFLELYRQAPDILEEYNRWDARLLLELEEHMGFAKIEQVFCRIGNSFTKDYHIATKIDSLLLKRGKQTGIHFRSKKIRALGEAGRAAYKKTHEWEAYEGGFVLSPKTGIFDDVAALDFKSLYPSVMIAFNISPETYITNEQAKSLNRDEWIECPTGAKFLVKTPGFVPLIFQDTGEKRKIYSEMQANEPVGSDLFLLYYRISYAFKRLGLSFYGDLGSISSRYFNPKIAEAVTLSGQYVLKQAIAFSERERVPVLYGDTDSCYVQIPASEGEGFVKRCNDYIRLHLREKFGVPDDRFRVELEYENYFRRMFFVRKKRYAGLMTMYKGKEASFTEVKGLECMRSDGIEYARNVQKTMIEMIVRDRRSVRVILDFMLDQREKVLTHDLGLENITITKGLMKGIETYKSKGVHVQVAEEFRARGGEYYIGMKVPYVITESTPKLVGVHVDDFAGVYDHRYYWDKIIYPPSFRILEVCYPHVSWKDLFVKTPPVKRVVVKSNGNEDVDEHDEREEEM
jgi:DNA polymerase I